MRAPVLATVMVGTVVGANLLVAYHDPISVGFGQMAPAGVLVAGLAFTVRDLLDKAGGWRWVAGSIAAGAVVSLVLGLLLGSTFPGGPSVARIALAGAAAFLLSELLDWSVFRRVQASHGFLAAVALSGTVGLFLDSLVFLWLAFGDLAFLWGQVLGKGYALAAAVLALLAVRRA